MNARNPKIAALSLVSVLAMIAAAPAMAQCSSSANAKSSNYGGKDIVDIASSAGQFNTLVTAVKKAGLVEALKSDGPFTVFAPTDEAFAKLPKGTLDELLKPENRSQLQAILKYHVISGKLDAAHVVSSKGATTLNGQRVDFSAAGGGVMVDNARVVKTDIKASNGVIHVIDAVILPSSKNIVETAQAAGSFSTLLTAATKAGLAGVLSDGGPFTVFAPTDDAFGKLPEGTLQSLLRPENKDTLVAILKYHVVSGRIYSNDALTAGKAQTLQGEKIAIAQYGGTARVNDATLIATDLDASNGVIHVIDRVILPGASDTAPEYGR